MPSRIIQKAALGFTNETIPKHFWQKWGCSLRGEIASEIALALFYWAFYNFFLFTSQRWRLVPNLTMLVLNLQSESTSLNFFAKLNYICHDNEFIEPKQNTSLLIYDYNFIQTHLFVGLKNYSPTVGIEKSAIKNSSCLPLHYISNIFIYY